jgi:hypothetical protein
MGRFYANISAPPLGEAYNAVSPLEAVVRIGDSAANGPAGHYIALNRLFREEFERDCYTSFG